jgi:PAS domain S-box-containing protein
VEQSPSIVIITNNKGCIEYVNPKFTQVTGYTLEEMSGENPRTLKSGETSPEEYRHLWQTITDGQEWRGEFHNRKKSGELYWESASISPIRNTDGEISHFVAVKEDITERKRLASEVEVRNQELLKHRELTAIGRLANMVAHDLRNPLSSVKMGLQILQKQANTHIGEQERELIQISMDQVRYMEEILTDLLIFSRPDAIALEWIKIDKLLETTVASLQKQIDEHHVAVSLHCQPGLPRVHGDPVKLRQVFSNLIINAVQACSGLLERKPEVAVNVALAIGQSGTKLQVEVSDNGPGIPPALSEKVFEPFFTMRAKGSGLGLSIVKRIVEQHHGRINLEPRSRGGTRAVVTLLLGHIGEFTMAPETVT